MLQNQYKHYCLSVFHDKQNFTLKFLALMSSLKDLKDLKLLSFKAATFLLSFLSYFQNYPVLLCNAIAYLHVTLSKQLR